MLVLRGAFDPLSDVFMYIEEQVRQGTVLQRAIKSGSLAKKGGIMSN